MSNDASPRPVNEPDSPELEAVLQSLVSLTCDAMKADGNLDPDQVDQLVRALSTNGWKRHESGREPLSVVLKQRAREACPEPAIHRGGGLDGIVGQIQKAYNDASRYDASAPPTNGEKPDHQTSPRTTLDRGTFGTAR